MQFYRIELAEQRRLMGVMEHHSREGDAANAGAASEPHYASSGAQTGDAERGHGQKQERKRARFPFSITAGVEKGSKNRYRNIWPFEHARVRLHAQAVERRRDHAHGGGAEGRGETQNQLERGFQLPQVPREELPPAADTYSDSDAEHDDYVNASYVQPLGTRRRYIATQGPLEATFGDFWTLVWQQNTRVIVMLTREIEGAAVKCGAYWLPGTYGPLRVELLGCAAEGCTGLIRRTLRLTHAGHPRVPPRRVVQLQYLGWPDMNVPEDARGVLGLVDAATGVLRRALRAGAAEAPVVLHCSAGVGRTGGFIAVDAVLDAVRREAREMYGGGGRAAGGVGLGLGSGSGLGVASRPGSGEGVAGISAHMRAAGLEAEAEAERMDVDVDVDVNVGAVDVYAEVGRGMRTPMQVDSAEGGLELRMGLGERPGSSGDGAGDADVDMGETRRWAERVADTRVLSAFSPAPIASFPSTTSSSRPSALSTTASFPPSTASSFPSTPFQFQAPTHPTAFSLTLPAMQRSLLNANTNTSADAAAAGNPDHHPQNPETKAASLPIIKPGALPLSVRRGYADYRLRTFSAPSAAGAPPA
ncbi:protein-tyrosine phosphatase-like protein, partial [Mycena epipterygia]